MEIDLAEKFNRVLEEFDFQKVRRVMELLDWKWANMSGFKVPDIDEMKEVCCRLFDEILAERKDLELYAIGTGGFMLTIYKKGSMILEFIVAETIYDPEVDICY